MATIKATEAGVVEAARKAIAASQPMGMGFLPYSKSDDTPADEQAVRKHLGERGIFIDYFNGRMVKFWMRRIDSDTWESDDRVSLDYQSWCREYPSYEALFTTAT